MCSPHCILLQWYDDCPTAGTSQCGLVSCTLQHWNCHLLGYNQSVQKRYGSITSAVFHGELKSIINGVDMFYETVLVCRLDDHKCVIYKSSPQTRGMWCCVESFYFKILHIQICYYETYNLLTLHQHLTLQCWKLWRLTFSLTLDIKLWRSKFSSDLRKPCWKTGESLSYTEIFFHLLRKLNLFQI